MIGRPHISESTKRLVRQRCGFGCVMCGLPIYHYDHVTEFAETQDDSPENLTLLCPNHHDEKTRDRISAKVVEKFNLDPYNRRTIPSTPHRLMAIGDTSSFKVGGMTFNLTGDYAAAIVLDGQVVLGYAMEEGWIKLDMQLRAPNGLLLLEVIEGELCYRTDFWDVRYVGRRLLMKSNSHGAEIDITFTDNGFDLRKGLFLGDWHFAAVDGDKFTIGHRSRQVPTITYENCIFEKSSLGICEGVLLPARYRRFTFHNFFLNGPLIIEDCTLVNCRLFGYGKRGVMRLDHLAKVFFDPENESKWIHEEY